MIDHPQERAWHECEADAIALMGIINGAVAQLVQMIRRLLDADGWAGWGIQSPEHWVSWKAAVSHKRAADLVQIARRIEDLPACWALFLEGRLTEDAMARIARRVPADHDAAVAAKAPTMLISQLERALAACPPLEGADPRPRLEPERHLRTSHTQDGWLKGTFCLPPDEGAIVQSGLAAARDAEFRDREGLAPDAALDDVPEHQRRAGVSDADALVRMGSAVADGLDPTLRRTGCRGDRNKVVLHVDVARDGSFGPGQLHLGPTVPDSVARFLSCDAEVMVAAYQAGQLLGINPTVRTVPRNLRRVIERRDQGCAHPQCRQTRWLHVHHIAYWRHRGLTVPSNLICLCPRHHRELHEGVFSIEGDPEAGSARFLDRWGRPIEPPGTGPPPVPPDPSQPSPFTPPTGEPMSHRWFAWR